MLEHLKSLIKSKKPVNLVLYGDSISEVGRSPKWHGGASAPEQNWGAVLAQLLQDKFPDSLFNVSFFGIGGHNSYEGLGRLDGLSSFKPDLVLVAFGANDCCYHFLQPEETQLALATLTANILKCFKTDIILVSTAGDNPEKPFFQHLEETVDAQKKVAEEVPVPFVNMREAMLAATDQGKRWADFHINEENCHPTDPGHRVWAETVYEVIEPLLTI